MAEGSGLTGTEGFCGGAAAVAVAASRVGGSGGRTGGRQMAGFSVDFTPSLSGRRLWKEGVRLTAMSPLDTEEESEESEVRSWRLGGVGLLMEGTRGGGSRGGRGLGRGRWEGLRAGTYF